MHNEGSRKREEEGDQKQYEEIMAEKLPKPKEGNITRYRSRESQKDEDKQIPHQDT